MRAHEHLLKYQKVYMKKLVLPFIQRISDIYFYYFVPITILIAWLVPDIHTKNRHYPQIASKRLCHNLKHCHKVNWSVTSRDLLKCQKRLPSILFSSFSSWRKNLLETKKFAFIKTQTEIFAARDAPGNLFYKRSSVLLRCPWMGDGKNSSCALQKGNLSTTEMSFFLSKEGPYLSHHFH